ncbi:MAG: archaetidylserine decarboxylase [Xanthomonadales bacterium]|nr:archaetidylserine decarboxylase [Xanthomonadales bacterium]
MKRLFVALQYLLPHHLLSRLVYVAVRWTWTPWKNLLIRVITWVFRIDTQEAVRRAPDEYVHFNDFFTRELTADARPIASGDVLACPSDGKISQAGKIEAETLLQAKGRHFTLQALLAERTDLVEIFENGHFATIYLAPSNYHRVHMPVTGRLTETIYVPGRLFSVSPLTVANVPNLFARNERLICCFETDHGEVAVILVGAMLVSGMETVWGGECGHGRRVVTETFEAGALLQRGEEMGRFNMGSTVIVLCREGTMEWTGLTQEQPVQMGEAIGRWK